MSERRHFILNSPGLDQSRTCDEEERTYQRNEEG